MRQSFVPPRTSSEAPRLLNQVRDKIRLKHYGIRTEQAYSDWVKRLFCLKRAILLTPLSRTQRINNLHSSGAHGGQKASNKTHDQREDERLEYDFRIERETESEF